MCYNVNAWDTPCYFNQRGNIRMGSKKKEKPKKKVETSPSSADSVNSIRLSLLKQFGSNSVITGSDLEKCTYGRIHTGSLTLDLAIGGGLPIGRAIQLSGAKSTCKTSLCNHIASNAQKTNVEWIWTERSYDKGRELVQEHPRKVEGLICGYIDAEGTQDEAWMRQIGVDTDTWLYNKPSGLEEALNMAHSMQQQGVNVIFIDSVDSLEPTLYYETEAGESARMGEKQKLLGEYLRKFTTTNNRLEREGKLPCTLVLLNQLREKIGGYGDPEYTPGGRAIEFYISIDLRLRKGDWITMGTGDDKQILGQVVKFKSNKNKTFRQQQVGEFDFYFDDTERVKMAHIDTAKEVILEGVAWGVIERAGSWFRYKGDNLAQGADNAVKYLLEHKELFNSVRDDLFNLVKQEEDNLNEKDN